MTSSFAESLRKLADEAAKAKRLKESLERQAEEIIRKEALRAKRAAKAHAYQVARKAKLQAEREQQKIAAETERIRQQEKANTRAESQRIKAEKKQAQKAEFERRDEEERLRLHEVKLNQLCTDIYRALAVAAWDGVGEVLVDDDVKEFQSVLLSKGISVKCPVRLVKLANKALAGLLESTEQFARAADNANSTKASIPLIGMSSHLRQSGHFGLSSPMSKVVTQLCANMSAEVDFLDRRQKDLSDNDSDLEKRIFEIKSKIRDDTALLNNEMKNAALVQMKLAPAVAAIKKHLDDIASSYKANLPQGIVDSKLSLETKAAALRLAYGTFIHSFDFNTFSLNEIINLIRLANDKPLIKLEDIDARLERLNYELATTDARLNIRQPEVRKLAEEKEIASSLYMKAFVCQEKSIKFEAVLDSKQEGVDSNQLRFEHNQYVGPTRASLSSAGPDDNSCLSSAYSELVWMSSEEGKDFAGYVDIVLSELAKEGARSVGVIFDEAEPENKIEVGKVSLVCNIGCELLILLFSMRGINVEGISASDDRTSFKLSW